MESILKSIKTKKIPINPVVVISNNSKAEGLKIAKKLGISTKVGKGYRALANISDHGGQEVPHLHFHLFGGEKVGKMVE